MSLKFNNTEKSVIAFGFAEPVEKMEGNVSEIQILKTWNFKHAMYGEFNITETDLKEFEENFNNKVRKIDLAVDVNHDFKHESIGWFKEVYKKGKKLFAKIEWNAEGVKLIKWKVFRYFSPELHFTYRDEETGKTIKNLLIGGGITNRPFFKGMQALKASEEGNATEKHYFFNLNNMKFKELFEKFKDSTKLSFSESEAVRLAFSELSEADQDIAEAKLATLEAKFSETPETEEKETETPKEEEKETTEEKKEGGEEFNEDGTPKTETPKEEPKDEPKEKKEPEEVKPEGENKFSEAETEKFNEYLKSNWITSLEEVKDMQKKFSEQAAILKKNDISEKLENLVFSETNKKGVFNPSKKAWIVDFVAKLNTNLTKEFFEIMPGALIAPEMFKELGAEGKEVTLEFSVSKETPEGVSRESHVLDQVAKQYCEKNEGVSYEDALGFAETIIKEKSIK